PRRGRGALLGKISSGPPLLLDGRAQPNGTFTGVAQLNSPKAAPLLSFRAFGTVGAATLFAVACGSQGSQDGGASMTAASSSGSGGSGGTASSGASGSSGAGSD